MGVYARPIQCHQYTIYQYNFAKAATAFSAS